MLLIAVSLDKLEREGKKLLNGVRNSSREACQVPGILFAVAVP